MKFAFQPNKPRVNLDLSPLCNFRSGKGYLWALVRDQLANLQLASPKPLNILDAACHSLITRDMFPKESNYFGLDISKHRLKAAFSKKRKTDVLLAADLTRPFTSFYHFDVVVSLNTLSHIPTVLHRQCLDNLLSVSNIGSSLLINTQIDQSLGIVCDILLQGYESVSVVYFDSFLSERDELKGLINFSNVNNKIDKNELSLPNDASLHRQALFLASNKLSTASPYFKPPVHNGSKIFSLTQLPDISTNTIESDSSFASSLLPSNSSILVSSGLLTDPRFIQIISIYEKNGLPLIPLSSNMPSYIYQNPIYILGLEAQWVSDIVQDRLVLNLLRSQATVPITLVQVFERFGLPTSRSLIFEDT